MLHRRRDNNARTDAAEEERASITMIALMTAAKRDAPFSTPHNGKHDVRRKYPATGFEEKLFDVK